MPTDTATASQAIVSRAVSAISEITTLPEVTVKIIDIVENHRSTAKDLHDVIKTDPAMSAKILKVVNSAFYGLPGQISGMDRAIVLLGLSAVKNIAIAASISRLFKGDKPHPHFSAKDLWRHTVAVAVAARKLTIATGNSVGAEDVFVGGLIHDLGIMIERQTFGDQLLTVVEKCLETGGDFCDIETELLGANHQEFGVGLATKWKFPKPLLTIIGYHHQPELLPPGQQQLASIVEIADLLCAQEELGFSLTTGERQITPEMLQRVGLNESHLDELREVLAEDVNAAESSLM
jgi:putative nucleotidyltransferase with HDIG domain